MITNLYMNSSWH